MSKERARSKEEESARVGVAKGRGCSDGKKRNALEGPGAGRSRLSADAQRRTEPRPGRARAGKAREGRAGHGMAERGEAGKGEGWLSSHVLGVGRGRSPWKHRTHQKGDA